MSYVNFHTFTVIWVGLYLNLDLRFMILVGYDKVFKYSYLLFNTYVKILLTLIIRF